MHGAGGMTCPRPFHISNGRHGMVVSHLDAPIVCRRSRRRSAPGGARAGMFFVLPALRLYSSSWSTRSSSRSISASPAGTTSVEWVGLANPPELILDDRFWLSLQHVIWVIIGTVAPIVIGMLLAILLWRRPKGFTLFRTVYFMPQVLSTVVIGIVWNWIYNPIFGILNTGSTRSGWRTCLPGLAGRSGRRPLRRAHRRHLGHRPLLRHLPGRPAERQQGSPGSGHRRWANAWQRFWNVTVPQMASVINDRRAPAHRRLQRLRHHLRHDRRRPANATEVLATYTYRKRSPRTTSATPPPCRW